MVAPNNGTPAVHMRQLLIILNDGLAGPSRLLGISVDRRGFVLGGYGRHDSLTQHNGAAMATAVSVALEEALDIAAARRLSRCVIDVRTDNGELIDVLTRQKFKPRAYHPDLLCERGYALGAAQFADTLVAPTVSSAPITLDPQYSHIFNGM